MRFVSIFLVLIFCIGAAQGNPINCDSDSNTEASQQGMELLQTLLKSFQGLEFKVEGPNCWNAALVSAGILKSTRPVTKPEFWFWMNSKYCKALKDNEPLRTGDIGSLFYQSQGNYHSFMRVTDNVVFSKNSPQAKDKYEIQSYESMFYDNYKTTAANCKGTESNLRNKGCPFEVVYHRCQSVEEDFYKKVSELKDINSVVESLEPQMTQYMLNPASVTKDKESEMIEKLGDALTSTQSLKLDGDKEFARKAMEYRIVGLLQGYASVSGLSDKALSGITKADEVNMLDRGHIPQSPSQIKRSN